MKKILVPTDFSRNAETALYFAMRLAKQSAYELLILNIVPTSTDISGNQQATLEEVQRIEDDITRQTRELQFLCKQIDAAGDITYTYSVEPGINVIESIVEIAKKKQVEMIVMGTRGETGEDEFVFGTITSGVIEQASCPVLAIPENTKLDKRIDRITYATDFIDSDLDALGKVEILARIYDSQINLLHVYDQLDPNKQPEQAFVNLTRLAKEFENKFNYHRISCQMLCGDDVETRFLEFIKSGGTDMLVLLSQQKRYLGRLLDKSLSADVARVTSIPLLVFHYRKEKVLLQ